MDVAHALEIKGGRGITASEARVATKLARGEDGWLAEAIFLESGRSALTQLTLTSSLD